MNLPASTVSSAPFSRDGASLVRPGRGDRFGSCIFGLLAAAVVCFPLVILAIVAPKFAEIFRDFGVALPAASAVQIRVGVALASPLGMAVLVLAAIAIALAAGFAWRVNKALGLILICLCCLWFAASIGIVVVGMMLPLETVIQSLQKGGAV